MDARLDRTDGGLSLVKAAVTENARELREVRSTLAEHGVELRELRGAVLRIEGALDAKVNRDEVEAIVERALAGR
jgi:uncharacterized protein YggE